MGARLRIVAMVAATAMVAVSVGGIAPPASAATGSHDNGSGKPPKPPRPLERTLSESAAAHANSDAPGIAKKADPGAEEEAGSLVASPTVVSVASPPDSAPAFVFTKWTEQGPGPTLGGQDEGLTAQQNPVTGAVTAIATDPASADVAYVGTANGGIWKTTNATASSPTWTPLTDHQLSLAISDLAISPASSSTLYAATGSFSSGALGEPGVGVYKSTDSGATWTLLGASHFLNRRLGTVRPTTLNSGNVVMAGVYDASAGNDGVWRSTDGGTTWARISGSGGLPEGGVNAIVGDPGNANRFYAAVRTGTPGVYRSTDGGITWSAVNTGLTNLASADRILLSVHNDASVNAVYAATLSTLTVTGVFRSTNQGGGWTAMDLPPSIFPGNQANLHGALLADRTSATKVYIAGDRQAKPFPNGVGANDFSLRAFVGNAAVASGSQWSSITNNGANATSPHADSRRLTFDASGNILAGTDGGIYRLSSPATSARVWSSVIGTLRATEFWSTGYDTSTNTLLGGAQDTGSPEQTANGSLTWRDFQTADGGQVAVDTTSTAGKSIRYTTRQNLGGFNRATFDSAGNQLTSAAVGLIVNGTGGQNLFQWDPNIRFVQPYVLNNVDPTRMLVATADLYESSDRGDTLTDRTGQVGAFITAAAYGGRANGVNNADVAYFATAAPSLSVRTTAGGAFNKLTNYPGGTPISMAIDPQNWHTVVVVDTADHVWVSTNTGTSWSEITLNLHGLQPGTFASQVTFLAGPSSVSDDAIAVAGYGGVFGLRNPTSITASSAWTRIGGGGLPNVLVEDLRYDPSDDLLVAGTFGRGAWTLAHPELTMPKFLPQLSISDPTVLEPASGTTTATFTVRLSSASSSTVAVNYATSDGTATAASGDYNAVATTALTFAPGTTSRSVSVTVNADNRHEPDETFSLTLSSAANAALDDTAGTATILDNTGPFLVSVADASVTQPTTGSTTLNFPVTLSATPAAGESATVVVATLDGTATAAAGDYNPVPPTTLTFTNATGPVQNVAVTVNSGPASEANENPVPHRLEAIDQCGDIRHQRRRHDRRGRRPTTAVGLRHRRPSRRARDHDCDCPVPRVPQRAGHIAGERDLPHRRRHRDRGR